MHSTVLIRVDAAAVSQSPPYISAKFKALDAVGMAPMMNRAIMTELSMGKTRRRSSITPSPARGDTISLMAETAYTRTLHTSARMGISARRTPRMIMDRGRVMSPRY